MPKIISTIADLHQAANKTDIVELAEQHAQQITDYNYDLVTTYVALKRYETYLNTLIKTLQTPTVALIKENGEPPKDYANAKVKLTRRRSYDFTKDEQWKMIEEEALRLKKLRKEREQFLKNIKTEFIETVDESTGEIVKTYAPQMTEKEGIMVKL